MSSDLADDEIVENDVEEAMQIARENGRPVSRIYAYDLVLEFRKRLSIPDDEALFKKRQSHCRVPGSRGGGNYIN